MELRCRVTVTPI